MEAFILKGSIYERVDIISNLIKDYRGRLSLNPLATGDYREPVENQDYPNQIGAVGYGGVGLDGFNDDPYDIRDRFTTFPAYPTTQRALTSVYSLGAGYGETIHYINNTPRKYRFIGDLSTYKTHLIGWNHARSFMYEYFKIEERMKNITTSDFLPYVCSSKTINRFFEPKKTEKNEIKDRGVSSVDWEDVGRSNLVNKKSIKYSRFFSKDRERVFCLGCSMGIEAVENILMSAIDTSTNIIGSLSFDKTCAKEIKKCYISDNRDNKYDKIEKWFYNNDITISCENPGIKDERKKNYIVKSTPTIYDKLSGDILFLDHKSSIISLMHSSANALNGYVGDCYNDQIAKRGIGNRCHIDLKKKVAVFIDGTTGKEYHRYGLPDRELEDRGIADMLELEF